MSDEETEEFSLDEVIGILFARIGHLEQIVVHMSEAQDQLAEIVIDHVNEGQPPVLFMGPV